MIASPFPWKAPLDSGPQGSSWGKLPIVANPRPPPSSPIAGALLLAGLLLTTSGCPHRLRPSDAPGPGSVSLPTLEGGVYHLGEAREDLLVVTFFATWCMPCLAEIPYLRTLHRRPGVRVVAISVDEGGKRVLFPFKAHFEIDYPILLSDISMREGHSAFGVIPAIPATFLLTRRRRVHAAILGGIAPSTFDALLEAAAKEKVKK